MKHHTDEQWLEGRGEDKWVVGAWMNTSWQVLSSPLSDGEGTVGRKGLGEDQEGRA